MEYGTHEMEMRDAGLACCVVFSIWRERPTRMAFFDMRTCNVRISEQNTLELSPLKSCLLPLAQTQLFTKHGLCFFASVAAFLFLITPPLPR
jgi:hypothetical protein